MRQPRLQECIEAVKQRLHESGINKCPVSFKAIARYVREGAILAIHPKADGRAAVLLTWPEHLTNMIPAGFVTVCEKEGPNGA